MVRYYRLVMYAFKWPPTTFRSESYIGSAVALPDIGIHLSIYNFGWPNFVVPIIVPIIVHREHVTM